MRKNLFSIILILVSIISYSQQMDFNISGQVINSNSKKTVDKAFVELFNKKDSLLVSIQVTDSLGLFRFKKIDSINYFIRASHPEYQVRLTKNFILKKDLNDYIIELDELSYSLSEVVVVKKLPIASIQGDKLIVNVKAIPGIETNNSLELLSKLPGLWVENEESIKLNGSGDVTILINGKRQGLLASQDIDILKTIPAENIEKVEIISGGSAKYESSFGSVINIITKNKTVDGYYLSITNGIAINDEFSNNHNIFGNLDIGKFQSTISLGFNNSFRYYDENGKAIYNDNQTDETNLNYNRDYRNHIQSFSVYGNVAYNINEKNRVNLTVSNLFSDSNGNIQDVSDYSGASAFNLDYINRKNVKNNLTSMNLDYEYKIDTLGTKVNFRYGYLDGFIKDRQDYTNRYTDSGGEDVLISKGNIPLEGFQNIGKIDFEMPYSDGLLELGAKYTKGEIENLVTYSDFDNTISDFVINTQESDSLAYKESVFGAYALVSYKYKKFNFKGGLRVENTNYESILISENTSIKNDYSNVLPNLVVSYKTKGYSTSLKYTTGITRPEYTYLNPFRYYINEFAYREGNPNLKPRIRHTISSENSISDFLQVSIGYHRIIDMIFVVNQQVDNSLFSVQRPENALSLNDFYANVSLYYSLVDDKLNGQLNLYGELYNYDIKPEFVTSLTDLNTFKYFHMSFNNSYKLTDNLSVNNSFSYRSNATFYQVRQGERFRLDLGMSYKLLDKKLLISASLNDIFNTYNYENTSFYNNFTKSYDRNLDLQRFKFSIRYNINGGWKKTKSNTSESNNEELNRFKN